MTKKELVSAILEIKEVDTRENLLQKKNDELEKILKDLQEENEKENIEAKEKEEQVVEQVDLQALMEKMKAEMLEELKEQAKKEAEEELNLKSKKESIDKHEMIPVMNVSNGQLIYVSKKTGAEWYWENFGDIEYMEFQELISINSGSKRFLNEPYMIVLDDRVVDYLGLTRLYEKIKDIEHLDRVFDMNQKDFEEVIEKSPRGIKHTIITRARDLYNEGKLDSIRKINYLNDTFNAEIGKRG